MNLQLVSTVGSRKLSNLPASSDQFLEELLKLHRLDRLVCVGFEVQNEMVCGWMDVGLHGELWSASEGLSRASVLREMVGLPEMAVIDHLGE